MDIDPSDTLQYRSAGSTTTKRHICPLQLEVIRRGIDLWTNPGDVVFSPFTGIGSEGFVAIEMGRKFVGAELKQSNGWQAAKEHRSSRLRENTGSVCRITKTSRPMRWLFTLMTKAKNPIQYLDPPLCESWTSPTKMAAHRQCPSTKPSSAPARPALGCAHGSASRPSAQLRNWAAKRQREGTVMRARERCAMTGSGVVVDQGSGKAKDGLARTGRKAA